MLIGEVEIAPVSNGTPKAKQLASKQKGEVSGIRQMLFLFVILTAPDRNMIFSIIH